MEPDKQELSHQIFQEYVEAGIDASPNNSYHPPNEVRIQLKRKSARRAKDLLKQYRAKKRMESWKSMAAVALALLAHYSSLLLLL